MMMFRRCLVVLLVLVCIAADRPPSWPNPGTDTAVRLRQPSPAAGFTVAIIGDRTGGPESGLAVLEQAVAEINLLQPDLVIHIGDIVPGYLRDMAQWEADAKRARAILDRLEAPFFPIPGNHDVITGSGDTNDHRGEDIFKRYFGPLYYSFNYAGTHFACLYTDEQLRSRPRVSQAQIDWLRADLEANGSRQIFVFMHKPLWDYEDSGWDAVHDLLLKHRVRAVFAGHYHHYYKAQREDGIQYYVLGVTGGQLFSPELAGGLEHYCLLHVRPDGYRLALIKPGHVLPDDYVGLADFKAMEALRFLRESETGVIAPIDSPEDGPLDARVRVRVRNPLDRPIDVTVRGLPRGAGWEFGEEAPATTVKAGATVELSLPVHSDPVSEGDLVPPDVEVGYAYVDAQGRSVPIELRRRVPLLRRVTAPHVQHPVVVDGRLDESDWALAGPLKAAVWQASAYETGQPEPRVRLLAAADGLYVGVEARDAQVSSFRAEQVLCDAVFVGASLPSAGAASRPPVVALFPFGGTPSAVRARWNERRVDGMPATGVRVAAAVARRGDAWTCEAFVPWQALLGRDTPPASLRFNAGVWDNDGDLFTELHSWAPTEDTSLWGTLNVAAPSEPLTQ